MKNLSILVVLTMALSFNAKAATELFHGESNHENKKEAVTVECLEGKLGACTSYQFQVVDQNSGETVSKTEALNEADALKKLADSIAAFDHRFHTQALFVATAVPAAICIVGFIEPHTGVLKAACPLIPVGIAIDVVKAPLILPAVLIGRAEREIKFSLLQKRVKKILSGKDAKSTHLSHREFEDMSVFFR